MPPMRSVTNGVGINFDVIGPADGRPVILLHGFPDSGRLWRNQVPALAAAGFKVLAPDLRGYGASDKPAEVKAYSMQHMVGDVMGVLDAAGVDRTHVVGHDWGAALAWIFATFVPQRTDHLVALSVGHPAGFHAAGVPQREKSWYMLLFQFEGVAEEWLSREGWAAFREWAGHPDAQGVIADLEASGSLTPGLNWYRANLSPRVWLDPPLSLPSIAAPVMGVWSVGDRFLLEEQMTGSAARCAGGWRYERLEGAGHWMQLDAPEDLNGLLLDFLPGA